MEILSYVLDGELAHKDSQGDLGALKPGWVQRMSAGTGIMHSEFNGSKEAPAHFLQIWIVPAKKGAPPRYEDREFPLAERKNALCLLASPEGEGRSLSLHQDARVYASVLDAGQEVSLALAPGRGAWVQVARGVLLLNASARLEAGDGAAAEGESRLALKAETGAEFLVFDLA